jgi:hypothetical protein
VQSYLEQHGTLYWCLSYEMMEDFFKDYYFNKCCLPLLFLKPTPEFNPEQFIMNILTFDIEEWFHILDNESTKTINEWKKYDVRIHQNRKCKRIVI